MLSDFWKGVLQEVLAGVATAAVIAVCVWVRRLCKTFALMEISFKRIAEAFPDLTKDVADHGRRLDAVESDVATLKMPGATHVPPAASARRQRP
jgi:hypothetical protein